MHTLLFQIIKEKLKKNERENAIKISQINYVDRDDKYPSSKSFLVIHASSIPIVIPFRALVAISEGSERFSRENDE